MANIAQKITSYVHGISQQPDHLKKPGQVRNLLNALPDVTFGLMKRPGSEFISVLNTADVGKWFTIYRDNNEEYLGLISSDGLKVWSLLDGLPRIVRYNSTPNLTTPEDGGVGLPNSFGTKQIDKIVESSLPTPKVTTPLIPYLNGAEKDDIDILTINDFTIFTNKNSTVLMGGDNSTIRPYEAFLEVKALEYNTEYVLNIFYPGTQQDVPVTYATALVIEPGSFEDKDGSCPFVDKQDFTVNSGSKTNLRFTVEVRGQPFPAGGGYSCGYSTYVTLLNGGQNWKTGDSTTVTIKGRQYKVTVSKHATRYTYSNTLAINPYLTPKDQTAGILGADAILDYFKVEIEKNAGWTTDKIGNGLYIKGPTAFSAAVTAGRSDQAMQIMTTSVNNISKLPIQCKDGYIVKVVNSGNDEDDYYLKFIGTASGIDGAGVWQETVAPGIMLNLNYNTMPHQIVRMPDGSFMVSPIEWEDRLVGDDKTNPQPSFVNKRISKTLFYRNRFGLLSDENIILSRAGDFFNFFVKTALVVSDSDPIDLACSSTTPCVLHNAVGVAAGLILFSQDKQFLFGTSQDILSPKTAKVDTISTYECDTTTPVIDMGTTVGFVTSAGKNSRFQEMSSIVQNRNTEVIEQSKIVQELLPANLDLISGSKDDDMVAFAKSGEREVYFYKYFNDGERRLLSCWYRWSCPGDLIFHSVGRYNYYAVYDINNQLCLTKTPNHASADDVILAYNTPTSYSPHIDVKSTVKAADITYNRETHVSKFKVKYAYDTDAIVFSVGDELHRGRSTDIKVITAVGNEWEITVEGDWTGQDVQVGYLYTMSIDLPHFYYTTDNGTTGNVKTDTRMYLTLHRAKLQFSKIGLFDITVNRKGKDNTFLKFEASPADDYDASTHEVQPTTIYQVPIYEKNTNTNITLSSTYPTPCTLLSIEWEGKVSTKSYKGV